MDERSTKKSLEPKINNPWEHQKTYFGVAAAQSSTKRLNPGLPDALLGPLVTVLDPCTLHEPIHTRFPWEEVERRLAKNFNLSKSSARGAHEQDSSGEMSDGGASRSDSPGRMGGQLKGEKEQFMEEIIELITNIKKYNDPSLASTDTWIEKAFMERIARQLVLIQCYLPGLLQIDDVVNALLFENGPIILEHLLIEMPENVVSIVNSLLSNSTPGVRMRYRNETVARLIHIYPQFARRVVEKFSKFRNDCVFACRLAVDQLDDRQFLEFLEPRLADRDSQVSKTVLKSAGRQVLPLVTARLLRMAEHVLDWQSTVHPSTSAPPMGNAPWCTRLSFCLVELMNTSLEPWKERDVIVISRFVFRTSTQPSAVSDAEIAMDDSEPMDLSFRDDSVDSIVPDSEPETDRPRPQLSPNIQVEQSPFGDAHEIFVLSALIAIPFFTQYPINQTHAVQPPDRAVENWLDITRKRALMGKKITSSFVAHLVHVHACIMSSRIDELAEFASEGMRQKVELNKTHNHAQVLKNAFTSRCMTEIEVAKRSRSVCLSVTKFLAGNKKNGTSIPLRSIHALQTAGVYKAFQIDIGMWLEEQLDNIQVPASELLADVVDGFAQSTASSAGKGLSEEFVEATFAGEMLDKRTVPKRLFVLLFLCSYREGAMRIDSSMRNMRYKISLYRKLPVRYLISVMEAERKDYDCVRSKIITRSALLFPYLMPTPESMNLVMDDQRPPEIECEKRMKTIKGLKDMTKKLELLEKLSLREQLSALPLVLDIFSASLKTTNSHRFGYLLCKQFDRYEQVDPRTLFERSVDRWLKNDEEVTVEDVIKIPSLLFRCERSILNSPPHFYCFVRALNFFNKMVRVENRLKLLEIIAKTPAGRYNLESDSSNLKDERRAKEMFNGAYLDIQHSTLVHALIEVCDSKRMKDDPSDFGMLEKRQEIRRIACEYIHRTFLDHEGLIRIVLHQKIPFHQVRDLVDRVPALFAGHANILEMLSLADPHRRFFAVVFAAEICRKYRVRESLETARVVCDIVHSLHKFGELPSAYKLWQHVAPALMVLTTEFPSLSDSISRLLLRVATNAKNRLAVKCGLLAGDRRHEEHDLIRMISSFLDRNTLSAL
ncbi:unnamed protein product [Caenorhabditis sp. 36 PRJEB53466]|nr:unnamed protein product [Caenorhabditis sp. 36 PRJEB53466]